MGEEEREPRATFANMAASTAEDWLTIATHFVPFARKLPDRVLAHLRLLDGDYGGFPVDRLRTACRRRRARTATGATKSTSSARCCTTSATRSARTTIPTSPPPS